MYIITCDGNLLYDPRVDDLKVANAKLQLEVNRSGSFDFTIYPAHPLYGTIQKLKSVIEVYQDGLLLFRGRVLNDRTGLFLNKEFECEGDLAFFNDTIMRPFEYTGNLVGFIQSIIDSHNAQAGADKQFTLGNVTVTDPNDFITRSSIDYQTSWEVIENRLIKNLGGYIVVRRSGGVNYIDYLVDSTIQSLQELKLEENILDIIKDTRSDTIITALIPLGAKLMDEHGNETDQRLTISSVNGGLDYVHDVAAVAEYGWIFDTKIWDGVTDPNNLLTRANQELAVRINLGVSVELKAIDLSMIKEKGIVEGSSTQNGIPTPDNPIPVMSLDYKGIPLRKIGNVADTYDIETGKLTRRVGALVLTGHEVWTNDFTGGGNYFYLSSLGSLYNLTIPYWKCTHAIHDTKGGVAKSQNSFHFTSSGSGFFEFSQYTFVDSITMRAFFTQQHSAGTPVTVYYQLKTPTVEYIDTSTDEIRVFEYVNVKSEPHGINTMALITKLSINMLDPKQNTFTLGFSYDTFTEKQVLSDKAIRHIQSDYVTNQSIQEVRSSVQTVSSTITQQADQIALKADQTTVNDINTRLNTAEQKITPTAITSTVRSSTEYTNDLGAKENTVFKQNTSPAHLNGRFWLDTSVTPNVLNRSNGTAWVKATPTQASEVGAYSSGQVDTLLTSYSTITQTSDAIALEFGNVGKQTAMNGVELFPQGWRNSSIGSINPFIEGSSSVIASSVVGFTDGLRLIQANGNTFLRSDYIPHSPNSSYFISLKNTWFEGNVGIFYVGLEFYADIGVSGSNNDVIYSTIHTPVAGQISLLEGFIDSSSYNSNQRTAKYVRLRILCYWNVSTTSRTWLRDISVKRLGTPTQMQGAKYVFDGSKARFYGDGQEWYDNNGNLKVSFDTVNNRFIFKGQVEADSGLIGRFSISGNDLVYTSELFDKDYDRSDLTKLHRILLGFEPTTPYDLAVYDFNNSGTLNISDLSILDSFIQGISPLPTPRKRIRSIVRIGTNQGALTTQSQAENGSLGPITTMQGERITTDLLNIKAMNANIGNFNELWLNGNAVIEGGNNSDGYYVKFADGTMECFHRINSVITLSPTTFGSLFRVFYTWTFPATFISPVRAEIMGTIMLNDVVTNTSMFSDGDGSTTQGAFVFLGSATYNQLRRPYFRAIGRWK